LAQQLTVNILHVQKPQYINSKQLWLTADIFSRWLNVRYLHIIVAQ